MPTIMAAALVAAASAAVVVVGAWGAWLAVSKAPVVAVAGFVVALVSVADASSIVATLVVVCSGVVAVAGALRLRPVKWVWRTLVADPFRRMLTEVLTDHTKATVEPMIEPIRQDVAELRARFAD